MSNNRELTAILLGDPGVGKSTWINAFLAKLTHRTLRQAVDDRHSILLPVPVRVTTQDGCISYTDEDDDNEDYEQQKAGKSVTRCPRTYRIAVPDQGLVFNVIDTPGIDLDDPDASSGFVDGILRTVVQFESLDAICVVLKADQRHVSDQLKNCLGLLLGRLKGGASNVLFCVTHAELVNFKSERAVKMLKAAFAGASDRGLRDIRVDESRVFCFENGSVDILARRLLGVHCSGRELEDTEKVWRLSGEVFAERLIEMRPCSLAELRATYGAIGAIERASEPLLQLVKLLGPNKRQLVRARRKIQSEDGRALLYEYRVEFEQLEHPAMICTANRCVNVSNGEVEYVKICDADCRPPLSRSTCDVMDNRGKCRRCHCSCWKHSWVTCLPRVEGIRSILCKRDIEDAIDELREARRNWSISALHFRRFSATVFHLAGRHRRAITFLEIGSTRKVGTSACSA